MQTRREFLQQAALLSGKVAAVSLIPPSILKAMSIEPAPGSTYLDAEHVVILMQENRSFDHAFGALRGVRGFDDPRAIQLPSGHPVWFQQDAKGATYAPFPLDIHHSKSTWTRDLPHDRASQVAAGNEGKHDQWLTEKQSYYKEYADLPLTLGYYDRSDIPFYYAFADAFTICDQHFCSAQTCTTPNRLYLWTGTCRDPRDPAAIARLSNGQIDHDSPADWTTFPERLESKGISWKIYQNEIDLDTGLGVAETDWLGNFGDNPMEFFTQYHVTFHPARNRHIDREITALESAIARITPQQAAVDQAPEPPPAKLAVLQEKLAKLKEEFLASSPAHFDALPPIEQQLHRRAFTTNTLDPSQRQVTALRYRDEDAERDMLVPAGDVLHQFRTDTHTGKLPAVSWLVAPANFSDHPGVPWYGAWYISEVLDILTKNPETWKKTILILTYDENDGYFDHIPPFVPPHTDHPGTGKSSPGIDTASEFDEHGHPIGLGYRVPLIIASPWTRGGNVCSQVFDHTSVLQFLEVFLNAKTNSSIKEENITPWRRTICGDLTSVFQPTAAPSAPPIPLQRDPFLASIHKAKFKQAPDQFHPFNPEEINELSGTNPSSPHLAKQEPGQRPSCPLPYELNADAKLDRENGLLTITFEAGNKHFGPRSAGAPFQVYAPGLYTQEDSAKSSAPSQEMRRWSFAVAAGDQVTYAWNINAFESSNYHLRTYGPNGFYREYQGSIHDPELEIRFAPQTNSAGIPTGNVIITLNNLDPVNASQLTIEDMSYGSAIIAHQLAPGESKQAILDLQSTHGWYDFQITVDSTKLYTRRYAGRIETGQSTLSDPALGKSREV